MATRAEKQAELLRIQQEIAKLQGELAQLERDLANSRANPALADLIPSQERTVARTKEKIATLEQRAADVQAQIAAIPDEPPPQSAAADVANSAAGATQNPAPAPTSTGRLTTDEAATLAAKTETGTNAPVKPLTETQSVSPAAPGSPADAEGRPGGAAGVGAKGDDGATAANTSQVINAVSQAPFRPRNNVLDQYASYTYNIGWYLMTPEQYTEMQKTHKVSVSQYNLLVQSGGAPATTAGVQPDLTTTGVTAGTSQSAGRNPFFALDYYFDNLEIKSVITGKGTNSVHNAAELSFTVTETAGITLIDNLWKAVKQVYKDSKIPYSAAYYALIIRFYGYDENGKIVQASDADNKNAIVEKIIPFRLSDINFTVANKLVEYHIKATAVPHLIGFGSNLGVIKKPVQIAGGTVKDVLTKGVELAAVSADDGRKTTATPQTPSTPTAKSSVSPTALSATGSDSNLVNDDGMSFAAGNF